MDARLLFAGLDTAPALLLAVSGGPDSLALMLLAARWAAARGPTAPRLHVATVDHGLRAASSAEAAHVAAAARSLGLPHATLPWLGDKPRARIQERAREARYRLLAEHAARLDATHCLTAHHAGDQAETVLFRLSRGSGLGGLAGMRRQSPLAPGLTLVRPLLDCAKADLVALCAAARLEAIDDPSNRDPAYARTRIRTLAPEAARLGLDTPTLVRLARRLARAEDALEAEARRRFAALDVRHDADGLAVPLAPLVDAEPELVLRVLRLALATVAPGRSPRLDRLEALTGAIERALAAGEPHRATLGGTRVVLRRDTLLTIMREAERRRGRSRA